MLNEIDKAIIREVQEDLPLCAKPFEEIARRLGLEEKEVLDRINFFLEEGYIRRFGANLRHRRMGIRANPMIVWNVPEDRVKEIGEKLASFPRVTHCYNRPRLPKLSYNLYSMIHGETTEECLLVAQEMAKIIGIEDYQLLYSERELKKTSMKYFLEEKISLREL